MKRDEDLLSLDGDLGPASAISNSDMDALLSSVMTKWDESDSVERIQSRVWPKAASYVLALIFASSTAATAAWMFYERPSPKPSKKQPTNAVVIQPSHEDGSKAEVEKQPVEPETIKPDTVPSEIETPRKRRATKRKPKAEDLLKQANRLRRIQDWQRAARAYARVSRQFPNSDSEYVALVSEAEIRLSQLSEVTRAKTCYLKALTLRPSGILEAEILFGLSRVYRTMNNSKEERAILQRLLSNHEHSPFAALAKHRLEQM